MAIMATEQPQSVPVDQKISGLILEREKATVDEPSATAVNGHAATPDAVLPSEVAPVLNGDKNAEDSNEPTKDAVNQEAFTANGAVPVTAPLKIASEPPKSEDTPMEDVNGIDIEESTAVKPEGNGSEEPPSKDQIMTNPGKDSSAPESKINPPEDVSAQDAMELDTSTDRLDVSSSAEFAGSTQATSAISDAVATSSPQELSQSADVSKLDIKSPQMTQESIATDRAASPAKVSRERDEDAAEEPLAKRTRIDTPDEQSGTPVEKSADSIGVATGASPAPVSAADDVVDDIPNDQPILPFQNKEIRNQIARVKKTKNGMNFRASVQKLWPALWENYQVVIQDPVDLSLLETKLRENQYPSFGDFKADVQRILDNALKYNGPGNLVTIAATHVRNELFGRAREIAKQQEPVKIEKGKAQPTRHTEPRAATQPRRQSQTQLPQLQTNEASPKPVAETPATPASASASTSGQAFALPPNGIPQIRRDSTRDDGDRPKRPIHPPKNRDLDYASKNSRKKLDPEMKFYDEVLKEIQKPKYWNANNWFLEPVDPVALNIPTYFSIIKKPMDLGTISNKIEDGRYRTGKDVEKAVKQIMLNSELFNGEQNPVTLAARDLERIFKEKVSEKDAWMARNYPPSAASGGAFGPSPDASDQESEEESEEEAEEESESIRTLQARLTEEQTKLNGILAAKKPDVTMLEMQQNIISMLQRKLVEEKTKAGDAKKSKAKKKAGKPKSKAGPSSSTTAAASGKKAASGAAATSLKRAQSSRKTGPKKRQIGQMEKEVITNGISELDGPTLDKAVDIIKKDTNQTEDDDGQLELDIESLSQDALRQLFDLIQKTHPGIYEAVSKKPEYAGHRVEMAQQSKPKATGGSKPKKNKPMNKHEQERNIEKLRELKAQFSRQGSGSQEPMPGEGEDGRPGDSSEEEESDSEED